MKSHLQRPEKTRLLFSVWKVTLHSKCSALGWPWEVRTMNVKVDFTLCNSLLYVIDVATVRANTHPHHAQMPARTHTVSMQTRRRTHDTQAHIFSRKLIHVHTRQRLSRTTARVSLGFYYSVSGCAPCSLYSHTTLSFQSLDNDYCSSLTQTEFTM